jgi:Xaa-Pro aminopeptidase
MPSVTNNEELRLLSANIMPEVWTSALSESDAPGLRPGMIVTCEPGMYAHTFFHPSRR